MSPITRLAVARPFMRICPNQLKQVERSDKNENPDSTLLREPWATGITDISIDGGSRGPCAHYVTWRVHKRRDRKAGEVSTMALLSLLLADSVRFPLLQVFRVVSVAVEPSPGRILFFPLLCAAVGAVVFVPYKRPLAPMAEWGMAGSAILSLVQSSHFILLSEPQLEFQQKKQRKPTADLTFIQRLGWSANLFFNFRGVSWSCEVPGLKHSTLSRWAFVKSKIKEATVFYLLTDVTFLLVRHNPALSGEGGRLDAHGFLWQTWNVVVTWAFMYLGTRWQHTMGAATFVALGFSAPDDWPPLFGPLSETTTLRTFWGQTWHQCLRMMLTSHGRYLAHRVFNFRPGSLLSSYTQLYTAFFLSGLIHAFTEFPHDRKSATNAPVAYFFWVQAICPEDRWICLGHILDRLDQPFVVANP
ncbi:hypothetical protein NLJ89_g11667 [Agrocybe chaxingu]|uniref:Wax synthase domain-containing protein n=1 Tax=Agrocybe chaxingu TaxID=84603 RepID=A0A9W8MP65_9AGAR|nr:hypothetical protein NLJ89_g11667 [Agrocybe chaxingu]